MTDEEVMRALREDSAFNRARRVFSEQSARIEQASNQRRALSPIDMRRMEFEGVRKIAQELGVKV